MKAFDAAGLLVSGPWSAVGKADPELAAAGGNPSCDRLQRFGDTPTGTYEVFDLLPPESDARVVSRFGPHGILKLRPLSGEAAEADANGRTTLLIHGGDNPFAATDGSIRVPNPAVAELVLLVREDPNALQPRIQVVVEDAVGHAEWMDADKVDDPSARDRWYRPGRHERSEGNSWSATDDASDDILIWWLNYCNQLCMWNSLDASPPGDPAERFPWQSDEDRAAAAALKAAGFDVLPDRQPQSGEQSGHSTAISPGTLPDASLASDPVAHQAPIAVEPSFQPSSGSYDR